MNQYLYSAEQVRELDRLAIEVFHTPSYELMCRAGQALLDIVQMRWAYAKRILIVCGSGNNAGDGYVLARLLATGVDVDIYSPMELSSLTGDAERAYIDYQTAGGRSTLKSAPDLQAYDLIVDALLGSGLCRDVDGQLADVITQINACKLPVLAVDVPSGLNASTGAVCGVAVKATVTATFIAAKRGLLTNDGPDYAGRVFVDDLNLPSEVFASLSVCVQRLSRGNVDSRARNAHKGSYGSVLLLGANTGMEGAIALAGSACLRVGAGLVRIAGRTGINNLLAMPDLMRHDASQPESLKQVLASSSVIAVGPGLGTDDWANACFELATNSGQMMLLDADALNILAQNKQALSIPLILTPHPAEAGRLLACTTKDIQADRFSAVVEIANRYNAVVVLKGCGTLISDGESVYLCDRGNPSMASAGMGDVLTGVISGFLAQGVPAFEAAKTGVYLHATAGDLADAGLGVGLTASDVIDYLPKAQTL